jgi:hypothetical protein
MADSIITKIGLDDSGFHAGMSRVQRSVLKVNKALGLIGAGISVGVLTGLTRSVLDLADNISTASGTIGVSTDFLQEFQYAAEQSGVATDKATLGLQRFARRLAQAQEGGGELLPTLNQLGVAMFDSAGQARKTEDVLADFADAIASIEDPQAQLLAGFKAFDSEGAALINVLRGGAQGMAELRQQAHEAGVVLESDLIKDLDVSDKMLKRLMRQGKITFARLASDAIRAFKIGRQVAENFFDQFFRRLPILKAAFSRLLKLDFDGVTDELAKLKAVSHDLAKLYGDAVAEVDGQINKEKELLEVENRRLETVKRQTKAMEQQAQTQQKITDAADKLEQAKRDRLRLTKDELGALPSQAAATDPILAALQTRIANLQAGLTPSGDKPLISPEFERAKVAERQAVMFETLARELAKRGFGESRMAIGAQNRADFLRRANPFLKEGERDPFKVQQDQLQALKDQLKEQQKLSGMAGPQGRGLRVVPIMPE